VGRRRAEPFSPGRIAGGSSGGTAAAIAAGLADAGLGTDTGGSCRILAACCGIVGFRPSTGRYPPAGLLRLSETFDTAGPLARTAADVARLDAAIAGGRPRAPVSLDGVRLAAPRAFYRDRLAPEVEEAFDAALARLRRAGCAIVERDVPGLADDLPAWHLTIVLHEAEHMWTAHAEREGLTLAALAESIATPRVREAFRALAAGGTPAEAEYRDAVAGRLPAARRALAAYLEETGAAAIVAPALPVLPPAAGPRSASEDELLFDLLTRAMLPATVGRQPSVCLPIGTAAAPVGLLLDGRPDEDGALLALAAAVELVVACE